MAGAKSPAFARWKARAGALKREIHALLLAYRDPRTPWYARVFMALLLAYAFSPIDLIPDFLPVLGYLDDLVLLPLGILLAVRMIPPQVMAECRRRAGSAPPGRKRSWTAAAIILLLWVLVLAVIVHLLWRRLAA